MITLYQFSTGFGIPNFSPFCTKVEILLKMAQIPYNAVFEGDSRKGPKGKIPFIVDGDLRIGDSTFIQQHLEQRYSAEFDTGLTAEQRAIAHGMGRMCEEQLYWCLAYSRWIDDANWPKVRDAYFGFLPPVVRSIVPPIVRRGMRASLNAHGLGRHSREEIYELGKRDIDALAALLGDKPFMMGSAPTSLDAVAYPYLDGLTIAEWPGPLTDAIMAHPKLVAYRDRCRALWFG